MKKIIVVFLLCALGWLLKLSYDFFQFNHSQAQLMQSLQRIETNNALLNDQVAALKREAQTQVVVTQPSVTTQTQHLDAVDLIQQQLDLIEFSLKQGQSVFALEKLHQLDVNLNSYSIAPALKQSLHKTIIKDQTNVQAFAAANLNEQDQLNDALQKVDHLLKNELEAPKLDVPKNGKDYFWQHWLKVEKVDQAAQGLNQRALLLKEVQLRLLMLGRILNQDNDMEFQQELNQIIGLLEMLPDQNSQKIIQSLQQIKRMPKGVQPKLNTRALIGSSL